MTTVPPNIVVHHRDVATHWSDALASILSAEERHRAQGYRREDDRRRFVTGRHLLRTTMAAFVDRDAAAVEVVIDDFGRPLVRDAPSFSLSHAGRYVVLAIAGIGRSSPPLSVGVDIERVRDDIDPIALARQVLSPLESEILYAAQDRIATFFRLWTLKEALLKAAGRGLLVDPRTITIDLGHDRPGIASAPAGLALRGCDILPAFPGYAAAIAWAGPARA